MRTVIQTPNGPRTVPDWARCYCVSRHTPTYIHPMPWSLPDGTELWLCPNTHHMVSTLWALYQKVGGHPKLGKGQRGFSHVVIRICNMAWVQKGQQERRLEIQEEWLEDLRTEQQRELDFYHRMRQEGLYEDE